MRITVRVLPGKIEKRVNVSNDITYESLVTQLKINPEEVLVLKEGKSVPIDDKVEEGEITILRVISGG